MTYEEAFEFYCGNERNYRSYLMPKGCSGKISCGVREEEPGILFHGKPRRGDRKIECSVTHMLTLQAINGLETGRVKDKLDSIFR